MSIPIMTVGRYAGTPIDRLPNSYLRWLITQDFPKLWKDIAHQKLSESTYNDLHINVTRHALDMFSKRMLHLWLAEVRKNKDAPGIATFVAEMAQVAWQLGDDISKRRHQDDGTIKLYQGIKWVFNVHPDYPEYKDVITIIDGKD